MRVVWSHHSNSSLWVPIYTILLNSLITKFGSYVSTTKCSRWAQSQLCYKKAYRPTHEVACWFPLRAFVSSPRPLLPDSKQWPEYENKTMNIRLIKADPYVTFTPTTSTRCLTLYKIKVTTLHKVRIWNMYSLLPIINLPPAKSIMRMTNFRIIFIEELSEKVTTSLR